MKQLVSPAIILKRTDFGEADRILTLLTPQQGKLSLMAKGVRRVKSKLAGGIELFSVSDITYIKGRGEVGTLVSARLSKHYDHIVGDLERTMLGYELIKLLNKLTEDEPEEEYFSLLQASFGALDDRDIPLGVIRMWFDAQLLRLNGHTPNLQTDTSGAKLSADTNYSFDFDRMTFVPFEGAVHSFSSSHIKLLRLIFEGNNPKVISQIQGVRTLAPACEQLLQNARLSLYR